MFVVKKMEQLSRSELRKKIMTILYQINVYDKNKITYNIDDVIKEVSEIDNEFIKEIVYGVVTYKNKIEMGFTNEKELNEFINTISEDETLNARNYHYLRYFAIKRFYEN